MKVVFPWLREFVAVPDDVEGVAAALGLRGFEVGSVEHNPIAVIDFDITANRPDCLSVIGLAREAAAAYGLPLSAPDTTRPAAGWAPPIAVTVEDAERCPRYCAQLFEVTVGPSPAWLRERLEAAGVRSINNIVDVTNYVMIELGQPMHAFDVDRLTGRTLVIRTARPGERIRTLDGVDRALDADMLVIADAERPQAVGGVMGGADSEIGASTRVIALESAYFAPRGVRRTSRRLGLKTEASARFERGADIEAPPVGIARAAAVFATAGAARPLGPMVEAYPSPHQASTLTLRAARIGRVLGMEIPAADVPRLLAPLGFEVAAARGGWTARVPSFRVDVLREIDLIEEVARHYGYDRLPATFPALRAPQPPPDARILQERRVRQILTACGLSEAMTFAFIERSAAAPFAVDESTAALANPLSEKFAVLRPSLLPGLVDACAYNRRREQRDVRLFETGARVTPQGERRTVAFVWTGAGQAPHWSGAARPVDLFDVKGVAEALCTAFGVEVTSEPASLPYYVEGRAAYLEPRSSNLEPRSSPLAPRTSSLGSFGQLAPPVLEARGSPAGDEVYAAEIDLDALAALAPTAALRAEPLPRFPSVVRDLSILVEEGLPAAAVRGTIRSAAPQTLAHVVEFDRYRGKGVAEGHISLSLRLTFRSAERTLTDEEVDGAMKDIVAALAAAHGAERR
ncbi:MAG TPA: phenylalanine--tRNA ligase subunit beta [Vicinamibacterales bacterium]|nr:phenylalanine--tRNA ligase subunit beta [Vicinamibacterales bacterium]